jgi:hypothetical protein
VTCGPARLEDDEWRIARRPPAVMAGALAAPRCERDEQSRWIPQDLPASSRWRASGTRARPRAGAGSARLPRRARVDRGRLPSTATRRRCSPWLPAAHRRVGTNAVGDLRVTGTIRALPGTELFAVVLQEGARRYRFVLPGPAAGAGARMRIDAGPSGAPGRRRGRAARERRLPPARGSERALRGREPRRPLALALDGRELLAQAIEPAEDQTSSAVLVLEGEGADLDELMVYRDIYYTARGPQVVDVPAGCFYMLGDNTQDSSDSREWTFAVLEVTAPDGTRTRLRGNWREGENPRDVGYGEPDGPFRLLVDEWGEKHWFAHDTSRRVAPEVAPFVPRAMIQGKALAVFWPLDPRRDIWRSKWVN